MRAFLASILAIALVLAAPATVLAAFTGTVTPVSKGGTGATTLDGAGIVTKSGTQTISGNKTFSGTTTLGTTSITAVTISGLATLTTAAAASTIEESLRWRASDGASGDFGSLRSHTASDGIFIPSLHFERVSSNARCGVIKTVAGDDTGTNPLLSVQFVKSGDALVATRPLTAWFNQNTQVMSLAASGVFTFNAGTAIGTGGTTITKVLSATATLDFPDTASGATSDLTITVSGAADGDVVQLGIPNASRPAGHCWYSWWASGTDTVTVRFHNQTGGNANPASGPFRAAVTKF